MRAVDRAWELLADGLTPQQVVARLTPATKPEAVALARRLPLLHEREHDRGAAIVRLAARAGMRRFALSFAPGGRVVGGRHYDRPSPDPHVRELAGDGCVAEYVARYFPDRDHFQLLGPPAGGPDRYGCVPRRPIPLSPSGHWSHFADSDAVAAMGGPEAYLAALQAAGRDGWQAFEAGFTWGDPEPARKPRKPKPVIGEHTAKVVPPADELPSEPAPDPESPPPPGRLC